jgi:hypothetical protein
MIATCSTSQKTHAAIILTMLTYQADDLRCTCGLAELPFGLAPKLPPDILPKIFIPDSDELDPTLSRN